MITIALLWLGGAVALCARDLDSNKLLGWPQSRSELGWHMFLNVIWPITLTLCFFQKDER